MTIKVSFPSAPCFVEVSKELESLPGVVFVNLKIKAFAIQQKIETYAASLPSSAFKPVIFVQTSVPGVRLLKKAVLKKPEVENSSYNFLNCL